MENVVIKLPNFDEKDWEVEVLQETGLKKKILQIQYNVLHLTKSIKDNSASFERLAWFNIWTREYHLLNSTFIAYENDSEFLLEILDRLAFELELHCMTIMNPLNIWNEKLIRFDDEKRQEINKLIIDRLRAYTAWCLWNDLYLLRDLTHENTLKGIWDPRPARGVMENPEEYDKYKQYFGEIDIETGEKDVQLGLLKQRTTEKNNMKRVERWLNHNDLIIWKTKIEKLSGSNKQTPSFFSLFDESERSICQRLKSMKMRFGYVKYIQSSLLIHGSSMRTNIMFDGKENTFNLNLMKSKESIKILAKSICSACMVILMSLKYLQSELWPQGEQ